MARRSDHPPEELRRMALEAARELCRAEGLKGVTVRAVAERIGYAPGTLYNLYDNLDGLILALNSETLAGLAAALAEAAGAPVPLRADALVDAYFDFVEAEPRLWTMLFEHRLPAGAPLPDWYRAGLATLVDGATAALAPAMPGWEEGERRDAVVAMWSALHGISTLALSGKLDLVTASPPRALGHLVVGRLMLAGPPRA